MAFEEKLYLNIRNGHRTKKSRNPNCSFG